MTRFLVRLEWFLAAVGGGICLFAILAITLVTIFGRYVLASDLVPGGYNMIEGALFPLLVFWGLPLALREGSFPRLETLVAAVPGRAGHAVGALVLLVEAAIYAIIVFYTARYAINVVEQNRQIQIGTGLWPAWPVAVMVPASFALMLLVVARRLADDVARVVRVRGGG